jgi:hypothetical protein
MEQRRFRAKARSRDLVAHAHGLCDLRGARGEHVREDGMPIVDEDLARYVQQLESIFVDLRGRGVQWTPDDVGRAARWRAAGVPLAVARRVVAARVAALRHVHGETAAVPFELRHYERALSAAMGGRNGLARLERAVANPWAAFDGQPTGRPAAATMATDAPSGPLAWIAALAREGQTLQADDPAVRVATDKAVRELATLLTRDLDDEALLEGVAKIRTSLRKRLLKGIGSAAAADLKAELDASTPNGLGKEALREREAIRTEAWLSAHYGARWPTLDGWCTA